MKIISRCTKKYKLWVRGEDNKLKEFKPTDTLWYLLYVRNEPRNQRMRKLFRSRFRMPHTSFLELAHDMSSHALFQRWCSQDCTGNQSGNIKLLLLGALRYLGRGWTLDDI